MNSHGPLLTTAQLSRYLQTAEKTLRQWRWSGQGPRFVKVGRAVRYRPEEVEAWLSEQTQAAA